METAANANHYDALVVDDNWFNRDIFRIALEAVGYRVVEAESGLQAFALLDTQQFDLMILDLHMPQMDGHTVLQKVRAQTAHAAMRVIVVTANAHMATPEVDRMADYVMFKPIQVTEFRDFVERLKHSRRRGDAPIEAG